MKATQFGIALAIACSVTAAQAAQKIAFAYCPMKHAIGHGKDAVLQVAIDKAKSDCVMQGGMAGCCANFFGEDTKAERAQVMGAADRLYGPK